jgi:hypothetical protein
VQGASNPHEKLHRAHATFRQPKRHSRTLAQPTITAHQYGARMIDVADARTRFREAALNYRVALSEKDADRANDETATSDNLVKHWADQDKVRDLLELLLNDADPEVRFAAASHLLNHGGEGAAVLVLEELQATPSGLVAPTARLRLLSWRRDHHDDLSQKNPGSGNI